MQYKRVPLAMLYEGAILASGIRDEDGRLLLNSGVAITPELLAGLFKRGIRSVVVSDADWQALSAFNSHGTGRKALPNRETITIDLANDTTRALDVAAAELAPCEIVPADEPYSTKILSHAAERYSGVRMAQAVEQYRGTVDQVRNLLEGLAQNRPTDVESLANLSRTSLVRAAQDLDLFVCMGINPTGESSIFAHSVQSATLATAIGATLGLDEPRLIELGMGCLVHDAGMLDVDPALYNAPRVLSVSEFCDIARHPIIAADRLARNMKNVSRGVQMIAYQMHERCDGSGYPRGSIASSIHPLAKIAAVADAYIALISARPHRAALLPYYAMKKMLEDVADRLFDSAAVRGLLHTVSLFPLGSFVELNNQMVGKTIRANGPAYDRPIIEAWHVRQFNDAPLLVDLLEQTQLSVAKPLSRLW